MKEQYEKPELITEKAELNLLRTACAEGNYYTTGLFSYPCNCTQHCEARTGHPCEG